MEKSLKSKTIKKLRKTIQTSLKTMGKWVTTKMLHISSKFAFLAPKICDFSSEMQIACK